MATAHAVDIVHAVHALDIAIALIIVIAKVTSTGLGWDWIGLGWDWDGIGMGFLFPSFSSIFLYNQKHPKSQ